MLYGGGGGGLFGLWTGFWIAGFLTLWDRGLLYPGISTSDEVADYLRLSPEHALALAEQLFHIDLPTHLLGFVTSLVFVSAVFGAFIVSASRLTSLDPASIALRTYIWTLRSMFTWQAMLFCFAPSAMLFIAVWIDSSSLLITVFAGVVILSVLIIPISVCRPAVVANTQSTGWWKPKWPGFAVIGVFLGFELLDLVPDYLGSLIPNDWFPFTALVFTISLVLSTIVPLLQGTFLMAAASSGKPNFLSVFHWRVIGPWLALGLWILIIPALCFGPFLAPYIWLWKVVPILATFLEGQGSELPYVYQLVINGMNIIGKFAWMFALVPVALFYWLAISKLVAGFNQYTIMNSNSAHRVET